MNETMSRTNRHAWLQKHPTPLAARGEFHWYPEAGDADHRELRAGFVERLRGVEPPAVLWLLEPGRAAWGQAFSAIAPVDGRRYVGLVLSVVEGDRSAAELLAVLAPPPAAPWTPELGDAGAASAGRADDRPGIQDVAKFPRPVRGDVAGVARALLSGATGSAAGVDDPTSAELPRWIASIERALPDPGSARRHGVWRAADRARADEPSPAGAASPASPATQDCDAGMDRGSDASDAGGDRLGGDRVAELIASAWREPGSRAAEAWALLRELAVARGESVDQIGAALTRLDPGSVMIPAERAELAGCDRVVDVLHAWGRGRLDRSPAADSLATRLADLVALRALVRLASGEDAGGAIAEARWYALLPAPRRTQLLAAVARRTAALRMLVEAHHA